MVRDWALEWTYTRGSAVANAVGEFRGVVRVAEEDASLNSGQRGLGEGDGAALAADGVVEDLTALTRQQGSPTRIHFSSKTTAMGRNEPASTR